MKLNLIALSLTCIVALSSCENPISMKTKVHEDGSLDKTIILEKTNAFREKNNMFAIGKENGWQVTVTELEDSLQDEGGHHRIEFKKSFDSADEANRDLDHQSDTLFQIHTSFEKKFRWFYSYITYTETFKPINRFKLVSTDDYFTPEDHAFIERLPGDGKPISKADSIYFEVLNEKIADRFVNMGIFEEQFQILKEVISRSGLDKVWIDSLNKRKEFIYDMIDDVKGKTNMAEIIADSLKIPLPQPKASEDFEELSKNLNSRISFMSFANDGKYNIEIEMPWTITYSNADSVHNNTLLWKPFPTKFSFNEYTMIAESRKLNVWTVVVSAILLIGAIYVAVKKR